MSFSDRRRTARNCPILVLLGALLALLPAGCGDLPQPYRGRPGGNAALLSLPLAVRLAVPPPAEALLDDEHARALAEQIAQALQAQEVPAVATDAPWPLDWRVEVKAERQGRTVRPRFRLLDADHKARGSSSGTAVPLEDWAGASPEVMRQVALQAAPGLAKLLLQVDAARKALDPAALSAGPPSLFFSGVRGAPGDGNAALAARMREFLAGQGFIVQDTTDGATYGLECKVLLTPPVLGAQRVEIVWIVTRRDGHEVGRVAQLNEVPAGSLNGLWGDVAYAAAQQAAEGIRTVVSNATAPRPPEDEAAGPGTAAASAGGAARAGRGEAARPATGAAARAAPPPAASPPAAPVEASAAAEAAAAAPALAESPPPELPPFR